MAAILRLRLSGGVAVWPTVWDTSAIVVEGVAVDPGPLGTLVDAGQPIRFRDRDEPEFAGYRDAVEAMVRNEQPERMSVPLILRIHRDLAHPIVFLGAYILDFLSIHPVADRNGRIARTLTTRTPLERRYGVPRYVSVEQRSQRKMTKQERVRVHVLEYAPPTFTIDALRRSLPGISDQTIELVLAAMRHEGTIDSDDSGRNATWTRQGSH